VPILLIFTIAATALTDKFLTVANIMDVLTQSSIEGVMALGATFLIINGYRDLSLGALMGLCGALVVRLQSHGLWIGISVSIIVAIIVGFVNGFLVAKVGINTFIATMATMLGCRGAMFLYTGGIPTPNSSKILSEFGSGRIFGLIPNLFIVFMTLLLFSHFILLKTDHGRNTFAVGGNRDAASNAGINTNRTSIFNFIICSFGGALGGILMSARASAAYPNMGWPNTHFIVIVMVVLGGTKLIGGIGNVFHTLGGVVVYTVFQNVFNLLRISAFFIPLLTGVILIVTLYMDSVIKPASIVHSENRFKSKASIPATTGK
jgi:ribose transport system permease protein